MLQCFNLQCFNLHASNQSTISIGLNVMSKASYRFELATSVAELMAYYDLRRAIFCEEQGLFEGSDRDAQDDQAYPIVALYQAPDAAPVVVGVVRIYEIAPRIWYGGRLGTHRDFRRGWRIGKGLIHKAVTTANSWGCDQFLATVQQQNVRFFERLHWDSLEELEIRGLAHHRMEADLAHYPPTEQPRPGQIFAVA
jgi:putative N-acetyltransferase (TIGR04045 family)